MAADSASLLVLEGETLYVRATDGLERIPEEQVPIPLGKGFSGRIAAERVPVAVEDVSRIQVVSPWLRERLRSVVGVPIFRADHVVGVLHVGSTSQRSFDRGDIELLELVAARVGGALERTRLFESARAARADAARAADRLRRVQTATAARTAAMTAQEVSRAILDQGIGVVRADAGVLVVPSNDGRFLEIVATMGEPETLEGVGRRSDPFGIDDDAAICEAYRSGTPVWLPSRHEWERRFGDRIVATDSTARSILAVPLRIDEQRLGALGLLFEAEGRLSKGERRLATTFAEQAALALERARLFEAERVAWRRVRVPSHVRHGSAPDRRRVVAARSGPDDRRAGTRGAPGDRGPGRAGPRAGAALRAGARGSRHPAEEPAPRFAAGGS